MGLSDGSVDILEVINKTEDAVLGIGSPVTHFCWLEPEESLAVSKGVSVHVCQDIVAGRVLHSITIQYPAHRMVFSQKLDRLAVIASFPHKGAVATIDPQMKTSVAFHFIHENLSCFTFSQTTEELVCGTETHGLQLFNLSKQHWRRIEYPDTMKSVSSLPNGTVVANFADSGVQFLNLDREHDSPKQPTVPALTVHAFDQGRIVAILPIDHDHRTILLELATMSQVLTLPALRTHTTPANRTHILCASLRNHLAVYCFNEWNKQYMRLWGLPNGDLRWTVEIGGFPSAGEVSPCGTRIVSFHDLNNRTSICVWNTINGLLLLEANLQTDSTHPLDITFDSETKFYSHHDTYRIPFVVSSSKSEDRSSSSRGIFHTLDVSSTLSHFITRREPLSLITESPKERYEVDESHEWVVSDSKRVCWIPPGYIGSAQPTSYCWAGYMLIMAGQDGTLRKLTFRESI